MKLSSHQTGGIRNLYFIFITLLLTFFELVITDCIVLLLGADEPWCHGRKYFESTLIVHAGTPRVHLPYH